MGVGGKGARQGLVRRDCSTLASQRRTPYSPPGDVRLPARLLAKTFAVASRLAVVPRLLDEGWLAKAGIDPCEKKTKRREFARWRKGVLPGLPAGRYHCHRVSIAYLLLRQHRGEVRKKIELRVGESP